MLSKSCPLPRISPLVLLIVLPLFHPTQTTKPPGEDYVCKRVETYMDNVEVLVEEPVKLKRYEWCVGVPPRCSVFSTELRNRTKHEAVEKNRTVSECCSGFVEINSECVPECPPNQPCPNMKCQDTKHCFCLAGYTGLHCNTTCPVGRWGSNCTSKCQCGETNGNKCHHLTGKCILPTTTVIALETATSSKATVLIPSQTPSMVAEITHITETSTDPPPSSPSVNTEPSSSETSTTERSPPAILKKLEDTLKALDTIGTNLEKPLTSFERTSTVERPPVIPFDVPNRTEGVPTYIIVGTDIDGKIVKKVVTRKEISVSILPSMPNKALINDDLIVREVAPIVEAVPPKPTQFDLSLHTVSNTNTPKITSPIVDYTPQLPTVFSFPTKVIPLVDTIPRVFSDIDIPFQITTTQKPLVDTDWIPKQIDTNLKAVANVFETSTAESSLNSDVINKDVSSIVDSFPKNPVTVPHTLPTFAAPTLPRSFQPDTLSTSQTKPKVIDKLNLPAKLDKSFKSVVSSVMKTINISTTTPRNNLYNVVESLDPVNINTVFEDQITAAQPTNFNVNTLDKNYDANVFPTFPAMESNEFVVPNKSLAIQPSIDTYNPTFVSAIPPVPSMPTVELIAPISMPTSPPTVLTLPPNLHKNPPKSPTMSSLSPIPTNPPVVNTPEISTIPDIPAMSPVHIMTPIHTMPHMNSVPAVPSIPAVHTIPARTPMSSVPTLSPIYTIPPISTMQATPGLPAEPTIPSIPIITTISSVPTISSIHTIPTTPSLPVIPTIPPIDTIPAIHSMPSIPSMEPISTMSSIIAINPPVKQAVPLNVPTNPPYLPTIAINSPVVPTNPLLPSKKLDLAPISYNPPPIIGVPPSTLSSIVNQPHDLSFNVNQIPTTRLHVHEPPSTPNTVPQFIPPPSIPQTPSHLSPPSFSVPLDDRYSNPSIPLEPQNVFTASPSNPSFPKSSQAPPILNPAVEPSDLLKSFVPQPAKESQLKTMLSQEGVKSFIETFIPQATVKAYPVESFKGQTMKAYPVDTFEGQTTKEYPVDTFQGQTMKAYPMDTIEGQTTKAYPVDTFQGQTMKAYPVDTFQGQTMKAYPVDAFEDPTTKGYPVDTFQAQTMKAYPVEIASVPAPNTPPQTPWPVTPKPPSPELDKAIGVFENSLNDLMKSMEHIGMKKGVPLESKAKGSRYNNIQSDGPGRDVTDLRLAPGVAVREDNNEFMSDHNHHSTSVGLNLIYNPHEDLREGVGSEDSLLHSHTTNRNTGGSRYAPYSSSVLPASVSTLVLFLILVLALVCYVFYRRRQARALTEATSVEGGCTPAGLVKKDAVESSLATESFCRFVNPHSMQLLTELQECQYQSPPTPQPIYEEIQW